MADTQPLSGPTTVPSSAAPDALVGQRVGDYVVEAPLAVGGMGVVYRAVHPLIGRKVAVKVMRTDLMFDADQNARFLREAQALSALKHKGIIDVITFGTLPDGRQFMVTEFLDGEPLDALLRREGRLSPEQALGFADDILAALGAAHGLGVVHRDLKPANVFVSVQSNGEKHLKILDFGLAKQQAVTFDGKDAELSGARSSMMIGTPEYLAPEQAVGLQSSPQTDLYCLGVMLFEMLAGQLPFKGTSVIELMRMHVMEKPPRLGAVVPVSPRIDALVTQLLLKKPSERPASAEATRELVRLAKLEQMSGPRMAAVDVPLTGAPKVKEPAESLPIAPVVQRRPWGIAAAALLVLGGAAWFAWPTPTPPPVVAPLPLLVPEPSPAPPPVVEVVGVTPEPLDVPVPLPAKAGGTAKTPKPTAVRTPVRPLADDEPLPPPDDAWRLEATDKLGRLEMAIKAQLADRNDSEEALGRVKGRVNTLGDQIAQAKTPNDRANVERRMLDLRAKELR